MKQQGGKMCQREDDVCGKTRCMKTTPCAASGKMMMLTPSDRANRTDYKSLPVFDNSLRV